MPSWPLLFRTGPGKENFAAGNGAAERLNKLS